MHWDTTPIRVPAKPFLRLGDVASLIGVSGRTIKRWVEDGKFPAPRPVAGGKRFWSAVSIGVWLAWQDYCPAPGATVADDGEDEPETAPDPERPSRKKS